MVTVLVCDARTLSIEFNMNAIPVRRTFEKLACNTDWSGERVLRIVNALRASKGTGRQFA